MSKIDKESLVAEIVDIALKWIDEAYYNSNLSADDVKDKFSDEVYEYINSLPDEPANEDLDKAARLYSIPHYTSDIDKEHLDEYSYDTGLEAAFKAGAKWQKCQMMNGAVDGTIMDLGSENRLALRGSDFGEIKSRCGFDTKVKIIVIKEN